MPLHNAGVGATVEGAEITASVITASHMTVGFVATTTAFVAGKVDAAAMEASTITATKMANGFVATTTSFVSGKVDANAMAASTITSDKVAAGFIATTGAFLNADDVIAHASRHMAGGVDPITSLDAVNLGDDTALSFGGGTDGKFQWETADVNANELILVLPEGGVTDVPVFVMGDASIDNVDLAFFNGITEPTFAVINDAADAYVALDAGDSVTSGKGLYFKTAVDEDVNLLGLSVTGAPTIIWDESDDRFAFSHGINLLADSLVSGTSKLYFNDVGGEYIVGDGDGLDIYAGTGFIRCRNDIKLYAAGRIRAATGVPIRLNPASGETVEIEGGANYAIRFRDSTLEISSTADGQLDIDADVEVEITAPTIELNGNAVPGSDNVDDLGASANRWKEIFGVTVTAGDYKFDNDWRLSEGYKHGLKDVGIVFISPEGKKFIPVLREVNS